MNDCVEYNFDDFEKLDENFPKITCRSNFIQWTKTK